MDQQDNIVRAIAALEAQRAVLGDVAVDAALSGLRQKLSGHSQAISATQPCLVSGERKFVTVMFADVTEFTALSETLDPERVRALMNACFNSLVPCIEKYGGVVDKFVGDEIMALFGAPVTHEDDPERALRAALDMIEALDAFNMRNGTRLGMHFGINTGPVVAGGLGSDGRQQYSVMGDTVNTASRLADAARAREVVMGPTTHQLTSTLFDAIPLPDMKLKGRDGLVTAYRMVGPKPGARHARGTPGFQSRIVGRNAEMARLRAALKRLKTGHGGVIAISGEPGLGKSRLIAEIRDETFTDSTRFQASPLWAEGRNQSYSAGMGFWIVQKLLDDLLGLEPDTPSAQVNAALRSRLAQLLPPERFEDVYPYLARLRDLQLDADLEEQIRQIVPEALQDRIRRAFSELIRAFAHHQPVVLVWEDLHWSDPSSLGLLEELLPLTSHLPLLILLSFRPNEGNIDEWFVRAAKDGSVYETITLPPLDHADSERLVGSLLTVEHLPESTWHAILARAEGNPFFVEELVRSLIEAGRVIVDGERTWAAGNLDPVEIPATLQGVIAARVDGLPAQDKHTLQAASVIGRIFQQDVLGFLLERENGAAHLHENLTYLQKREFIRRSQIEQEYIFKHAITHDVTYNSLLHANRKELHVVTAEAIEALFPDRVAELAATLAFHYSKGEVPVKAVPYLFQAAARARETYSNSEAIGFYHAALAQANGLPAAEIARIHENLADVLVLTGHGDKARASYREARDYVPAEDIVGRSRLHRQEAISWMAQREPEKSLQACLDAEVALNSDGAERDAAWHSEWLEIRFERSFALYWLNQVQELGKLDAEIRAVVMRHGSARQRARYYRSLFSIEMRRSHYAGSDDARRYAQSAMDAAQEAGGVTEILSGTLGLGICAELCEEWTTSETHLREALRLAERIGDKEMIVTSLMHLTNVFRRRREIDNVRSFATRTLAAAESACMPPYISGAKGQLAWVSWCESRLADAKREALEAVAVMGKAPIPRCWALWPLFAMAVAAKEYAGAVEHGRALLAPYELPHPAAMDRKFQEAFSAFEKGRLDETRALLQDIVRLAKEAGLL